MVYFLIVSYSYQIYSRYSIRPDMKILQFLGNFKNSLPESELRSLANRLRRSIS